MQQRHLHVYVVNEPCCFYSVRQVCFSSFTAGVSFILYDRCVSDPLRQVCFSSFATGVCHTSSTIGVSLFPYDKCVSHPLRQGLFSSSATDLPLILYNRCFSVCPSFSALVAPYPLQQVCLLYLKVCSSFLMH
jgi:hypothetical protein